MICPGCGDNLPVAGGFIVEHELGPSYERLLSEPGPPLCPGSNTSPGQLALDVEP